MVYTIHYDYENLSKIKESFNPKKCYISLLKNCSDIVIYEFDSKNSCAFRARSLFWREHPPYNSIFDKVIEKLN